MTGLPFSSILTNLLNISLLYWLSVTCHLAFGKCIARAAYLSRDWPVIGLNGFSKAYLMLDGGLDTFIYTAQKILLRT